MDLPRQEVMSKAGGSGGEGDGPEGEAALVSRPGTSQAAT
jgi:hypothetical protein